MLNFARLKRLRITQLAHHVKSTQAFLPLFHACTSCFTPLGSHHGRGCQAVQRLRHPAEVQGD